MQAKDILQPPALLANVDGEKVMTWELWENVLRPVISEGFMALRKRIEELEGRAASLEDHATAPDVQRSINTNERVYR